MADRFYVNSQLGPGAILVQDAEAHHLAVVCRVRPDDRVTLFNGDGREYPGRVVEVKRREVLIEIEQVLTPARELPFPLEVAAPLPKGDRAQFLVEKLTELGVTAYHPLQTARSVVHPGEGKREKLHRHVIEASKQCGRNVLMQIEPPVSWAILCERKQPALRVLAHPGGDSPGEALDASVADGILLAVGPEGGFTDEEVARATGGGWRCVGLGPRILRIETAALVLAAACALTSVAHASG
jgi:16S rRNA (uracil1498-N3)-methyltransferase